MSKIEVGKTYKFKDYISDEEIASFNWDESKEESIGGMAYTLTFGNENTISIKLTKYALPEKEEKPSLISVVIGSDSYGLAASYTSSATIAPLPVYNQWFDGVALEPISEAPTITIPENAYDTNYDDLAIFFELDDPEPRRPVEPQFNVLDASFWDNPATRTGWPGIKTKKEKEIEVVAGGKYLLKKQITFDDVSKMYEEANFKHSDWGYSESYFPSFKFYCAADIDGEHFSGVWMEFYKYGDSGVRAIIETSDSDINLTQSSTTDIIISPISISSGQPYNTSFNNLRPYIEKEVK